MDNLNITIEYIRLEEEKARRLGKVYNWETATYGKIWDNEDVHDLGSVKSEFRAIVYDTLTSKVVLSFEPTVSSLNNDKSDFRISFDESDDEDCTVIFDKNSLSYKIISVNNLKTDSENDNDKVNMPLLPSPEPTVSYFDDLDYFKDFEKEFPAIVYNDAQTSKLNFLTEPTLSPQHIDEFNLKDETSLSECDEEEQNVLNFNDLFPFNVVYPDDLKSDKDNDDDKIDIEHSLGDLSLKLLPDIINTNVGANAHESNKLLKTIFIFSTVYTTYSLNEYCDNHDLSRLDNQSIERDRLIGIGFVLNFVKFISFTFGDKEMISVIEAYYGVMVKDSKWRAFLELKKKIFCRLLFWRPNYIVSIQGRRHYALCDVIKNGNSFEPAAQTTINADGTSTSLIPGPVTTKEKVQKKNDVKARSMLLMALPNEHLMTFNQYKDAKTLFAAIQTRFGGNEATKKTQKTLLKQIENISQEDLNLKFLRSLPSEWNTHVVVWRNKPDLDTMSFDDLYNNFKIVEQEVKGKQLSSRSDTAGYDKSKVECFNCHKMGYFARECRGPKNQDKRNKNQDSSRRTVNVEETSSKAPWLFHPNLDLSYSGLEELQQPEFEGYEPKTSKSVSEDISNEVRESPDAPLVEELVSNDKNMVPRPVLMKTGLRPLNTTRPVTTTHPKTTVYSARPMLCFSKSAQSTVKRPYQTRTTLTNRNFSQKVNTAKGKFYTARQKVVNTARPNSVVVKVVRENQGHPQKEYQGYVDSRCSRHMIRNMSYLSDFKEFDGGYVTFGGGAKGGKITSKGTLKTGKLDFEDVYFVKELQFNLFSVSQIFTWVFFLASKDETSGILKSFITKIENLVDKKKCIKKEFSVARTPQQNGVAERRNRTLIEAVRTMLVDSKLPTVTPPNWATTEYDVPGVLLHRSIAQDMRTTSITVI
ncbi:ribonuclease H-like domain-containing protein [Tanacetum coccineum]